MKSDSGAVGISQSFPSSSDVLSGLGAHALRQILKVSAAACTSPGKRVRTVVLEADQGKRKETKVEDVVKDKSIKICDFFKIKEWKKRFKRVEISH